MTSSSSTKRSRVAPSALQQVHVAILGMHGVGKSALTVKYMTRRFITEYDPHLEDTYCKHEVMHGREYMVWIMDTVEASSKEATRYLSWADVYMVVYSVASLQSFQYAANLLEQMVARHGHSLCPREHVKCLVGTKTDLERYRQVSKSDGAQLAGKFGAEFFECNSAEQYSIVKNVFHTAIDSVIARRARVLQQRREQPTSRNYSSDSEMQVSMANQPHRKLSVATSAASTSTSRSRDKSTSRESKSGTLPTGSSLKKSGPSRLFKLFTGNQSSQSGNET